MLFEIRYLEEDELKSFEQEFTKLKNNYYENFFSNELLFLKRTDEEYYKVACSCKNLFNITYNITFLLGYRSFLHERVLHSSCDNDSICNKIKELQEFVELEFNKLFKFEQEPFLTNLHYDLRMLQIYFYGSQIFYYGRFMELKRKRTKRAFT